MNTKFTDHIIYKEDKRKIVGRMYSAVNSKATLIFAHGFNANYRCLEHYGPYFADKGISTFFFDFCGGGNETFSDGKTTEMSVLTELEDYKCVLHYVTNLNEEKAGLTKNNQNVSDEAHHNNANNIFIMGESQGGYVASLLAGRCPDRVKGLILWYPAFVIGDDSKKRYEENGYPDEVWGVKLGEIYTRDAINTDIYKEIAGYKHNVLIIHGDADKIVPIEYSKKALDVYDNAKLIKINGAGHGFDGDDRWTAADATAEFVLGNVRTVSAY